MTNPRSLREKPLTMPIIPGNFDAAVLSTAVVRGDRMWSDDRMRPDFEAHTGSYDAIVNEQNANVDLLEDPDKDLAVRVNWVNLCGTEARDCTDTCDLSGPELGADSKDYELQECKEFAFTVDEKVFRTSSLTMEEVVAKGMLKADKAIAEAVNASAVVHLEEFKGANTMTGGIGTLNGTTNDTDIPADQWTAAMFAYIKRVGIMNEFNSPFLLSGSNLFDERTIAFLNKDGGNSDAALYQLVRTYFDLFAIDTINAPDLKTYMIDRGAVAFAGKARYSAVPTNYMTQKRFSIASRNLKGQRLDVYYSNRCVADTMKHDYLVKLHYDFFNNPTGCVDTRTGVIAFNRV